MIVIEDNVKYILFLEIWTETAVVDSVVWKQGQLQL